MIALIDRPPPLTRAGGRAKDRRSWLVETFLPKLRGLWTQTAASRRLVAGEKRTELSTPGEGPGFAFSRFKLLSRPSPPSGDEAVQCEAVEAAPTATNPSYSVSYTSSVLCEQKTMKDPFSQLEIVLIICEAVSNPHLYLNLSLWS